MSNSTEGASHTFIKDSAEGHIRVAVRDLPSELISVLDWVVLDVPSLGHVRGDGVCALPIKMLVDLGFHFGAHHEGKLSDS